MHWLWFLPLALLILYLSSPRFRGDIAERRVRRLLAASLERNRYTLLNDFVLPAGGGTLVVDHLVVSKFGVFVIESQYAAGWVSGGEFQDRWKAQLFGRNRRFDNPMHRNRLQAEAVARVTGLPPAAIRRFTVLVGSKGFRRDAPPGVLRPDQLIRTLRKEAQQQLDDEQAARVLRSLQDARVDTGRSGGLTPVAWIRLSLIAVLLGGAWLAWRDDLSQAWQDFTAQRDRAENAQDFHADGRPKTEQEIWEESLICAWSSDSRRCACYEVGGQKAEIALERCRELAERGSILKQ